MTENDKAKLTSKEKFDQELKQINKDINEANETELDHQLNQDCEDALKEMEPESNVVAIDKNLGETKVSMNKDEWLKIQEQEALKGMAESVRNIIKPSDAKLNKKQKETLNKSLIMFREEKISDPVLHNVVGMKIQQGKKYLEMTQQFKKYQIELLEKLKQCTDQIVKCTGAIEIFDEQILAIIEKNPQLLED